jgi:hypothetical protein
MMEADATGSAMAGTTARMGIAGGGPRDSGFSRARWRWSDRECGPAAARYRCRAGKRRWPRIGWASGR